MKKLLLILGVCLVAFSNCKKESSGSNTKDWTVFTVAYNAPFRVYFKSSDNFRFYLGQNYQGYTIAAEDSDGYSGACLVNNVAELDKIEDFDALSYQRKIVLYTGACAVERYAYYDYYSNSFYTAYTAFIIEDWETNAMLGRYKLIQVKYPNGEIYPEPID